MHVFGDGIKGRTKVVAQHEVEILSLQGWKLVFAYQDTTQMCCGEIEPAPPNPNNYGMTTVAVSRYRPATMTWFIMQQDEGSSLASLSEQLQKVDALNKQRKR